MTRPLIVFHHPCRDGFCAAWVAARALRDEDPELYPAKYGDAPPDVKGREVFILDFSYPRDVMEKLIAEAKSLKCLDHHKTAEAMLRGLPGCYFDMNHSGAMLAWKWFAAYGAGAPLLVKYVEDRDLWCKALPSTEEVNAWIGTLPYELPAWDDADTCLRNAFTSVVGLGGAVLAKVRQYVEEVKRLQAMCVLELDGRKVPCVNAPPVDVSELLHELYQGYPYAIGWHQRADGKISYSLRSPEGGADVSEVAKLYGGGGHKHAAGFVADFFPEPIR